MTNNSIRQAFRTQLLYLAIIPLAVVVVLVFVLFISEAIDQAKRDAKWKARNIAIEFHQALVNVKQKNLNHAEFSYISRSLLEPGFAGPVLKHLQSAVAELALVSAAFTVDLQGNVVESYPFPWYSYKASLWNKHKILESQKELLNAEANFQFFNPVSSASSANPKLHSLMQQEPFILVVSPLVEKKQSFSQPLAQVGFLVYLISIKDLVQAAQAAAGLKQLNQQSKVDVYIGENPVFITQSLEDKMMFSGESVAGSLMDSVSQPIDVKVKVFQALSQHLKSAYLTLVAVLLVFLSVFYLLIMYSKRLKQQIDLPLHSIVNDCESIGRGDINFTGKSYNFSEFQAINDALVTMSQTIQQQVQSILEQKRKAEKSEQVKSQFLANMSHEIRTPINGIMGMLTLVEKGELNAEQLRKVHLAQNSAKSLVNLVNDILDFSKIEADKMELEYLEFNLLEMLDSICEIMQVKAEEKKIELHLDAHKLQVRTAIGDEGRIRQILLNIIGNAIKFTESGGVRVIASYFIDHQNKGLFVCEVRDTGVGMTSFQQSLIFNNFVQADSTTTRKFGGTGLGLAISKKLSELMQGNISVSSEPGKGSCFTIELPLQPGEDAYPVNSTSEPSLAYGSLDVRAHKGIFLNKPVLLVEDNEINQEVVRGLLEEVDLKVEVACDGLQALNKLKQFDKYALILMDCQMPSLDGFQTTEAIRAGSAGDIYKTVPIVALTANAFVQDKQKCLDAGMDDYLSKPVDEQALLERVYKYLSRDHAPYLRRFALNPELEKPEFKQSIDSRLHENSHWDKAMAMKRIRNRQDRLNKLLEMFLEGTPTRMQSLSYALDQNDFEEVQLISHSIKGIAANLSAHMLFEIAQSMELAVKEKQFDSLGVYYSQLVQETETVVGIFNQELSFNAMGKISD